MTALLILYGFRPIGHSLKFSAEDKSLATQKREIIKIAHYYYDLGFNQQQIADKLNMSRPRVNRILKRAREEGIVEIRVHGYADTNIQLESQLEEKFGLKEAVVIDGEGSGRLGNAAMRYLESALQEGDCVGIAYGSTMAQLANAATEHEHKDISVIQLCRGANTRNVFNRPDEIANRLAVHLGAKAYSLFVPAIVENPELRRLLYEEENNREIFELFRHVNIAVVTAGAHVRDDMLLRDGYVSEEVFEHLEQKQCVGNVCLHFIDIHGNLVDPAFDEKIMSILVQDFLHIPLRVGVAGGAQKIPAILGAIRGDYFNVLITDAQTANKLLKA